MEGQPWSRFSSLSKRHQGAFQAGIDLYRGFEDVGGGADDSRAEFACPFCSEDFEIMGLCRHIDDEHRGEAKNGVCPVCGTKVGVDMVGHIKMQHGNLFKMKRGRRSQKGSLVSQSSLSLLKKELRGGHLQSLLRECSLTAPPPSAAPDPLLSSFISNLPTKHSTEGVQLQATGEGSQPSKKLDHRVVTRVQQAGLSAEKEEKARKSRFVRELVLSAVFHDNTL